MYGNYFEAPSFFLEINPDTEIGEILTLFCRSFQNVISNSLIFIDANGDGIDITIQKGNRTAMIVRGYKQLLERYRLNHGGWLKVKYVGRDKFLIDQAFDHNMHVVSNYIVPLKSLLDKNNYNFNDINLPASEHISPLCDVGPYVPSYNQPFFFPNPSPDIFMKSFLYPNNGNGLFMSSTVCKELPITVQSDMSVMQSLGFSIGDMNCLLGDFHKQDVAKTQDNVNIYQFTPSVEVVDENNAISLEGMPATLDQLEVTFADNNSNLHSGNLFPSTPSNPNALVYFIVKVVTRYQANHYAMLLPAKFAMKAFPSKLDKVKLKQHCDLFCVMKLRWHSERHNGVFITKGWSRYCKKSKLKGGSVLKFSMSSKDETVMSIAILRR
ncbi:hypothetical protein S245_024120 [Arachis hypogaea]